MALAGLFARVNYIAGCWIRVASAAEDLTGKITKEATEKRAGLGRRTFDRCETFPSLSRRGTIDDENSTVLFSFN